MEIIKITDVMNIINIFITIILMTVIYLNITNCFNKYFDYKSTNEDSYNLKYNKMEYYKSIIKAIISIIISITIISILYFLQD